MNITNTGLVVNVDLLKKRGKNEMDKKITYNADRKEILNMFLAQEGLLDYEVKNYSLSSKGLKLELMK